MGKVAFINPENFNLLPPSKFWNLVILNGKGVELG